MQVAQAPAEPGEAEHEGDEHGKQPAEHARGYLPGPGRLSGSMLDSEPGGPKRSLRWSSAPAFLMSAPSSTTSVRPTSGSPISCQSAWSRAQSSVRVQ